MIFGSKNKNILRHIGNDNIKIIEIYKKGNKTFQLFCDAKKSDGTIGDNKNYCLNLLTDNGFVQLIDNRQLSIPEVQFPANTENIELSANELSDYVSDIEEGFERFKKYADIIA